MNDMEGLYETPHDGSLWRTRWLGTTLGRFLPTIFEHERYSERFSTVAPYDFLKLYVLYACKNIIAPISNIYRMYTHIGMVF